MYADLRAMDPWSDTVAATTSTDTRDLAGTVDAMGPLVKSPHERQTYTQQQIDEFRQCADPVTGSSLIPQRGAK